MGMTKEAIKAKITTDLAWAERAILALYDRQTDDEQLTESTRHENGMGFTGADAEILSSFARQIARSTRPAGQRLSDKQKALAFKKLGKYAGQLERVAKERESARSACATLATA